MDFLRADSSLVVDTFPVGPLQCNCTILGDRASGSAVVVDPGWDAGVILERVEQLGLRVSALAHTHAHIDHINATSEVHRALEASCMLHEADLPLYNGIRQQASLLASWGLPLDPGSEVHEPPEPERLLVEGDQVGRGRHALEVLHTPGHTPGSLCFLLRQGGHALVLAGDTLFLGGVGRTDLWGGDFGELRSSISSKLYRLPDDTLVLPGHGPGTTIGRERGSNPFVPG